MKFNGDVGGIYFERRGEGPGLLLLHGLGGSLDSMDRISKNLDGFTRISVDIPCHGMSDDTHCSIDDMAGIMVNLMKSQGFDKFFLVGVSLGAMISERIAIVYPESILKAAFISPSPYIDSDVVSQVSGWTTADDGGASTLFSKEFFKDNRKEILDYERTHPFHPERISGLIPSLLGFDIRGERSEIKCIIIYGREDSLFGERMIGEMQKIFPNNKTVKIKSGHAIHRESPDEASLLIRSFFGGK